MSDEQNVRVLHLLDQLGCGGAQQGVKDLLESLSNDDAINHRLFVLRRVQNPVEIGFHYMETFPSQSRFSLKPILRMRQIVREFNPTILHCHLFRSQVFGWIVKLIWAPRAKLVFHERGNIYEAGLLQRIMLHLMEPSVDKFVTVSSATREKLAKHLRGAPEKITAVNNGIDIAKIRRKLLTASERTSFRRSLGISEADFIVGYAGRFEYQKNLDVLVEAVAQLPFESTLMLVGEGSLEGSIKTLAVQLGISKRLRIIGFQPDASSFLQAFDILVLPSRYEPFPRLLLEGLALGLPVIATRVDGVPEMIIDGENGLLFEAGKVEELVSKLAQLHDDSAQRERLGQNAVRGVERFSLPMFVRSLQIIYDELVSGSRRVPPHAQIRRATSGTEL